MMRAALLVCAASAVAALKTTDPRFLVLPPPRNINVAGAPVLVSNSLTFEANVSALQSSNILADGLKRMNARLSTVLRGSAAPQASSLALVRVDVHTYNEELSEHTNYDYELHVEGTDASIIAVSPYGALAAMESFRQLVEDHQLPHSSLHIVDGPQYTYRGLMVDTGRRFFPLPLLENLLDTMAAVKMSALHLHASDHCRFSVQSNTFPNLTDALTGVLGGFYTQADVASLISYATSRGIRVIPEFDVPGHSRGFLPLVPEGIQFCDDAPTRSQLYNDPGNATYNILVRLFKEMAGLFPDAVFNIGADETDADGPCTVPTTYALERALLQDIQGTLGKTPAGWEELQQDAGAATPETIIYSWSHTTPGQIIAGGNRVIDSNGDHFYFTRPAPGGPVGWAPCWTDISASVPPANYSALLGGEASMWTDTYCYIDQCGSSSGATPVAAALFPPSADYAFGPSVGGMIWPRGFVAASAFYNFNASVNSSDPAFVSAIWSLNDQITAAGGYTCPTNCSCDQLSACGVPYLKPTPPVTGTPIFAQQCSLPPGELQTWQLLGNGQLALATNSSMCVTATGAETYPLSLAPCASAGVSTWQHSSRTSELILSGGSGGKVGDCMDFRESDNAVGTYACGSGAGLYQLNQAWVVDAASGLIVSPFNGSCLTAVPA